MKIILSPAKTMKPSSFTEGTAPIFEMEAKCIREKLLNMPIEQLSKMYKFKESKTLETIEAMKDTGKYQALSYYNGTVFKQITTNKNLDCLFILDAMYGLLRPTDLISYYRLDLLMDPSLNKFWEPKINEILKDEDIIINLASKEFSKLVKHPHMITIDFIIEEDGLIKRPSMIMKKCRGTFINLLLEDITQDIKKITFDSFKYDPLKSTDLCYVYTRKK